MEPEIHRGRPIVIALIIVILVMWAFIVVLNIGRSSIERGMSIVFFLLEVGICAFLYRGAGWARWVQSILWIFQSMRALFVALIIRLSLGPVSKSWIPLMAFSLMYSSLVAVLLFTPSVRDHFKTAKMSVIK